MLQIIAERIFGSALNQWIVGTYWLWPLLEIIHFIGLSLLIGGLVVVDLSLVGVLRGVSWAESHRLLPLVVAGFFLNLATSSFHAHGRNDSQHGQEHEKKTKGTIGA